MLFSSPDELNLGISILLILTGQLSLKNDAKICGSKVDKDWLQKYNEEQIVLKHLRDDLPRERPNLTLGDGWILDHDNLIVIKGQHWEDVETIKQEQII